jgi:small subunit ribosomal protein S1
MAYPVIILCMSLADNPTMSTLLSTITDPAQVEVGSSISGQIISLAKNQAILSIPNVGLGMVRGKELYNEEYLAKLKVGETVEAAVVEGDNEQGYVELSFRAIGRDKIWQEITAAYDNKDTVPAKIRDANRGGFLIKVHGIDGFLPASLLSPTHAIKSTGIEDKSLANKMKKFVGQTFNVKLINISPETDSVIASEKAVSDEIAQFKLQKYKVGDEVEGAIVGIVDFGLFVRFDDDLEGLVHISEISWKKVENPYKEHRIGEKVKAKIVDIDKENRINLSIKQTTSNPWIDFAKSVKPGDKFKGNVTKIATYGAIVVNSEDIQGLCHISQISEKTIESPAKIHEILRPGQSYDFTILSVDSDEKLYLTLLPFDVAEKIQVELVAKQTPKDEEPKSEKSETQAKPKTKAKKEESEAPKAEEESN